MDEQDSRLESSANVTSGQFSVCIMVTSRQLPFHLIVSTRLVSPPYLLPTWDAAVCFPSQLLALPVLTANNQQPSTSSPTSFSDSAFLLLFIPITHLSLNRPRFTLAEVETFTTRLKRLKLNRIYWNHLLSWVIRNIDIFKEGEANVFTKKRNCQKKIFLLQSSDSCSLCCWCIGSYSLSFVNFCRREQK